MNGYNLLGNVLFDMGRFSDQPEVGYPDEYDFTASRLAAIQYSPTTSPPAIVDSAR